MSYRFNSVPICKGLWLFSDGIEGKYISQEEKELIDSKRAERQKRKT